jgi:hypothetical protein
MRIITSLTFLALTFCAALVSPAGAQPLTITTIAGRFDHDGYVNGVGTNAQFHGLNDFSDLAADANGFLYVVDGNSIRRISPDFLVVTLAGNPTRAGYVDASGTNALFSSPAGIAADANGNVYVADQGNYVIRKITFAGVVSTVAGDGTYGYVDSDAGTPEFQGPTSVALDSAGNIYVADYTTLRMITPAGVVSTLAGTQTPGFDDGTGTNAQFISPFFLAAKADGSIYVAMAWVIRTVTLDGTVSTLAGGSHTDTDGLTTNAGFDQAFSIALDKSGGLYVADAGAGTIRYVTSAGVVTTVAGSINRFPYPASNDGVGTNAWFSQPLGIAVDPFGNVYVVDGGEYTVLKGVPPSLPIIGSFSESPGGTPVRSNNPWQFTAYYTTLVSDLRLHVQSTTTTNDESSWSDLPGNPNMTHVGANWTLNTTDVPAGMQHFRVVASAPGYSDTPSAVEGPETVLAGIAPFGLFNVQPPTPSRSGASWTFHIVETSVISGLSLRVQSSADGTNWSDLSDGQMSTSDSVNWTVTSLDVPTGTRSFRVVASASTYPDQISQPSGLFTIVAGLPDIGFFDVSTGGTPTRSSNPWEFIAAYTDLAPGLQLRVQATAAPNGAGGWQDLPGIHYMTNNAGGWTLDRTGVPTGVQYFRAVASAPGYVDGVSGTNGPQTVLPGFDLWGYFSYSTSVPYSTATPWAFVIGQPSRIPGMSLRIEWTLTPNDENSWTDLPGGGQMALLSDGVNWGIFTTNLPTGPLVSFRVIASAPDYVDLVSALLGPFQIGAPLTPTPTTFTTGGTYTVQDLGGSVMNFFNAVGAVVNLVVTGVTTTIQGAITLTADAGSSLAIRISQGQVVNVAGLNVQAHASVLISGTVDGPVAVGIVSHDGGTVVSHDGGGAIGHDGASVVSNDGGSLAQDGETAALAAQIVENGLISQDGGGLIGENSSGLISQDGGGITGGNSSSLIRHDGGGFIGSKTPVTPTPQAPPPAQPPFTGKMTVNGNYTQFPGAALIIGIAGTNTLAQGAQQFDQLVVNGDANLLGGTIVFALLDPDNQTNLANAFQPPDGATFDVVVASNIVVNALNLLGPVWGDGMFFKGGVVTLTNGLQAVRLMATHVPPQIVLQNAGSKPHLVYGTNYTGYTVESSSDLVNWSVFSTGTNIVPISLTNYSQFFRLSNP